MCESAIGKARRRVGGTAAERMVEGWPIGRGVLRIRATDNAAAGTGDGYEAGAAARRTIMIESNDNGAVRGAGAAGGERRRELLLFLVVTLVVFPLLAVGIVGGYGFGVWIFQMIAGPPGPPGG